MVNIVTGDGGWDESTTTGFESRLSLNRCELISVTSSPKHLISLTQAVAAAAVVLGEAGSSGDPLRAQMTAWEPLGSYRIPEDSL